MSYGVITENGLVVGNAYDKYGTRNPVSRWLVSGFLRSLDRLVDRSGETRISEVGCGEGHLAVHLAKRQIPVRASDISPAMIERARELAARNGVAVAFENTNIFDIDPLAATSPLVVCCEVLEHLESPELALDILLAMADPHLILSVPREPIWRLLNLCRLKYVADLGNTPGHLQHWSQHDFLRLVRSKAEIVAIEAPFPWTMVLCRRR